MASTTTAAQQTTDNTLTDDQFYQDVIAGLTSTPKRLDSKYFYDAQGDKLFQELMSCEEYYPTNCEMEIFTTQTAEICKAIIADGDAFDLIELGAGDATKSTRLLKYLIDNNADFTYLPIDISENVISYLNITLPVTLPGIKIEGLNGEYFQMLKKAAAISNRRKVVLFLGSNIGNMPVEAAKGFCEELRNNLSAGDMLLIGIDLKKNPATVLAAYNDKGGITKRFNLNLLERINRELGGDFNTSQFDHYAMYDPETGSCKSYLISLADQEVNIGHQTISFERDEYIYMEISQKYAAQEVNELATQAKFKPLNQFFDNKKWFVDAIWRAE
ncbi:L-histidine N(alpha)-methyltransferase [Mucilaginibacter phyllosphaerae]|uniref:Dimethylhistidine N-methyltransferase n=1 Tax=Mucilaginibacter phyllosphaerae TaxID=1812349 RepID=A0A4Y8AFG9_9SPHI|nr:L-histidine N(alpha)-methyltransferase [Mucilaginibacter phyllosphaerae]MBB3970403.1 dimethylhistidine N-methyltransferase [Mucilaginibacter phyllosphaerae]TEW66769.1 L-histidine N(alpha)-methyltransferase [Mucilaginibacter phyllosphaerae]GGH11799.1 dimethylhistidine N-methyltransferase [Mucilaginibacter phyllosphaerae]